MNPVTVTAFQRHGFQFTGFQEAGGGGTGDIPWYIKYEFGRLARRFSERRAEEEKREKERIARELAELEAAAAQVVEFVPAAAPVIVDVPAVLEPIEAAMPASVTTAMKLRTRPGPDLELEAFHDLMLMLADSEEFA